MQRFHRSAAPAGPLARQGQRPAKRQLPKSTWYLLALAPLFFGALILSGQQLGFTFMLVVVYAGCLGFSFTTFENALYIFAFAIPMEQAFYWYAGARYSILGYLILAVMGIWIILHGRSQKESPISDNEFLVIAWLAWSGLSLLWTIDFTMGTGILLSNIGGFAVLYLFSRGFKNVDQIRRCCWFYMTGTTLITLVILPYYQTNSAFTRVNGRLIPSALGLGFGFSPHEVSRTLAISMICALMLWQYETTAFKRRAGMVLALYFGVLVPLCLSRGTVLAQAAGLLAWATLKGGNVKIKAQLKKFITMLLLVGSIVLLVSYINQEATMTRVEEGTKEYERGETKEFTTGRSKMWGVAWSLALENPVLGFGVGSFPKMYSERTGDVLRATHSEFLKDLAEIGFTGLLLLCSWVFRFGRIAIRIKTPRQVTFAWWIIFALIICTHDIWRAKDFWMTMGFIVTFARFEEDAKQRRALAPIPPRKRLHGEVPHLST